MKNALLPLLCLALCSNHAAAQYEAILNNPDVIWAAEVDLAFWIEPEFTAPDSVFNRNNYSVLLKVLNLTGNPDDGAQVVLASRIFKMLLDEKHPVFARPDSLRSLTIDERIHAMDVRDTVTRLDPETGEKRPVVVLNCWSYEALKQLKLRQLLFYNDKTDEFDVYTAAFAPLLKRNYSNEWSQDHFMVAPFWFKMPPYKRQEARQAPNLNDPNITWARRMSAVYNMPRLDSLRPLKDLKPPVMQRYLDRLCSDPAFDVKTGFDWRTMSVEERKQLLSRTDTVVSFNPETYEAQTAVLHTEHTAQELMQLRLVEDWFWDERLRYPVFKLYAFAPLEDNRDDNGVVRFKQPVLWHKLRE